MKGDRKRENKTIFCAYDSSCKEFRELLQQAKNLHNQYSGQIQYKLNLWEDQDINGNIIIEKIKESIESSDFFICELSTFNWNVFFELGYAIGKNKPVKLFLRKNSENINEYSKLKLLSDCGYACYETKKNLKDELNKKFDVNTTSSINSFAKGCISDSDSCQVLVISNSNEDQATLEINAELENKKIPSVYNNIKEANFRPKDWYTNNISNAYGVIINLSYVDEKNIYRENAEHSFLAGICEAIDKPIMFIGHNSIKKPMDYKEKFFVYRKEHDIKDGITAFVKHHVHPCLAKIEAKKRETLREKETEVKAIQLALNFIAEDEKNNLIEYFIENDFYKQAMTNDMRIMVGRKGVGKTALFIKLKNDLQSKSDRINVVLEPNKSDFRNNIELLSTEKSIDRILNTLWKIVILATICKEILGYSEKTRIVAENDFWEMKNNLEKYSYKGFFEVLEEYRANNSDRHILNIHRDPFVKRIEKFVFDYIDEHKYLQISIIADNLDCIWDENINKPIQAKIIRSLVDYLRELKDRLEKHNCENSNFVFFLREDIFLYIKNNELFETDKFGARVTKIDWKQHCNDLRSIIEKRFKVVLNLSNADEVQKVWLDHFNMNGTRAFDEILKYIILRPRDLLRFIGFLFEFSDGGPIEQHHFVLANKEYLDFIYDNMKLETRSHFCEIDRILDRLSAAFDEVHEKMDGKTFIRSIQSEIKNENRIFEFIEYLIELNYLKCSINNKLYTKKEEIKRKYLEKKFLLFRKNKIHFQFTYKYI